jgi:hypothetical protein
MRLRKELMVKQPSMLWWVRFAAGLLALVDEKAAEPTL